MDINYLRRLLGNGWLNTIKERYNIEGNYDIDDDPHITVEYDGDIYDIRVGKFRTIIFNRNKLTCECFEFLAQLGEIGNYWRLTFGGENIDFIHSRCIRDEVNFAIWTNGYILHSPDPTLNSEDSFAWPYPFFKSTAEQTLKALSYKGNFTLEQVYSQIHTNVKAEDIVKTVEDEKKQIDIILNGETR